MTNTISPSSRQAQAFTTSDSLLTVFLNRYEIAAFIAACPQTHHLDERRDGATRHSSGQIILEQA